MARLNKAGREQALKARQAEVQSRAEVIALRTQKLEEEAERIRADFAEEACTIVMDRLPGVEIEPGDWEVRYTPEVRDPDGGSRASLHAETVIEGLTVEVKKTFPVYYRDDIGAWVIVPRDPYPYGVALSQAAFGEALEVLGS